MSTNFYVYPGKKYLPTFKELLDISNLKINEYLSSIGIMKKINLEVRVQDIQNHKTIDFSLNDKVLWNENNYAWFYIAEIPGGTDAYFLKISELDKDAWGEECLTNDKAHQIQEVINNSIDTVIIGVFVKVLVNQG